MPAPNDSVEYELHIYDAVGRRDKRFDGRHATLSDAIAAGHMHIAAGDAHSFRVLRELYNSVNPPRDRWEPKT